MELLVSGVLLATYLAVRLARNQKPDLVPVPTAQPVVRPGRTVSFDFPLFTPVRGVGVDTKYNPELNVFIKND